MSDLESKVRKFYSKEEKADLLSNYDANSGESINSFARRNNLSPSTLHNWLHLERKKNLKSKSRAFPQTVKLIPSKPSVSRTTDIVSESNKNSSSLIKMSLQLGSIFEIEYCRELKK